MNTAQDELEGRISLFTTPPSFNRNRQGRFIEASPRERERPGLPLWENENPAGSKFLSKRIPCEIFSYLSFRFIKKKKKGLLFFSNLSLFFPLPLFQLSPFFLPLFSRDFIFEIIGSLVFFFSLSIVRKISWIITVNILFLRWIFANLIILLFRSSHHSISISGDTEKK